MSSEALPSLLLVEDGPLTLLSTRAALEEEGYRVVAVRHGAVALQALTQRFEGLITDIRLPGVFNGWQIAREARSRWPDIPVIYVTGEGEAGFNGGPQGALYVVINIRPHQLFQREQTKRPVGHNST